MGNQTKLETRRDFLKIISALVALLPMSRHVNVSAYKPPYLGYIDRLWIQARKRGQV